MTLYEIVKIGLIAAFGVMVWMDYLPDFPLTYKLTSRLNFKPFNCAFCLSFWIGIILSIFYLDPLFLTLPLLNRFINRI